MAEIFKFPCGGYDVEIVRKQDIIDCIEDNIIDKDVALAIVRQCEIDAASLLQQGRWVSIPFIGNIRTSPLRQMLRDPELKETIELAKSNMTTERYVMFRKQVNMAITSKVKHERYYHYICSISANKHRRLYKQLLKIKGEHYARFYMFALASIAAVDNEYETVDEANNEER